MKTKELIKQLQQLDPTGEMHVFAPDGDIYFADILPWYWDGRPGILVREEDKKFYNVLGMQQITAAEKSKIYLYTMSVEDVVDNDWENFDKLILEGDERFMKRARAERDDSEKIHFDHWCNNFTAFCIKKFGMQHNALELFNTNRDSIIRKDFNMNGFSLKEKHHKYWEECIVQQEGKLHFLPSFKDKDYNPPKCVKKSL